jgi:hypothetical protein
MALIYFSVGGNLYQNQPIKFDFIRDNIVEYARPVMIRLNHNIGKYVRLQLYFDAKWMMISEIQFVSGKLCYFKWHSLTQRNETTQKSTNKKYYCKSQLFLC